MGSAHERVIGELAIRRGLINAIQLEELLRTQEQLNHHRRLGQLMVDRGFITVTQLDTLLAHQREVLDELQGERGLFGTLAIERGYVLPSAVDECVRTQAQLEGRGVHIKIGQLMLAYGLLTMERFWEILVSQRAPLMCPLCESEVGEPRFTKTEVSCSDCGSVVFRLSRV